MIFDRIVLRNVGVFAGENPIILTPPDDRPIVLVGGLNGSGKTTLLEAVNLGLYGKNAAWSNRSKQAYKDYLRGLINANADPAKGAEILIEFERMVDGEPKKYALSRRWAVVEDELEETLSLSRDGEKDPVLAEQWEEYIEQFLPSKLANLFFFDGEQIKELAEKDSAMRILSSAVQSLLGLDLVKRLEDDLVILDRRKRLATKTVEERAQIEKMREMLEATEDRVAAIRNEGVSLSTDLKRLQKELVDWEAKYRKEGGEVYAQREQLVAERGVLRVKLAETEMFLRAAASGSAPLLLVESQLARVEGLAEKELEMRNICIIAAAEMSRDLRILNDLKKRIPANTVLLVKDVLEKTRPKRPSLEEAAILHPDEDFPERVRVLLREILPRNKEEIKVQHKQAGEQREALARLDQRLAMVPDADALAKVLGEIRFRQNQIQETEAKLVFQNEKLRQAEFEAKTQRSAVEKALSGLVSSRESFEHDQRILDRIPRVKSTLLEFRTEIVKRHAAKLEHLILESFQQLLRKGDLVERLRINPESFELELRDPRGVVLPFERLSAGERQILATAILWGLAKASGRPLPTIIDTPLGRLDSSHRTHLVQRYFPAVSHQVILLSTDEEIDSRYLAMMDPFVGRVYRLEFDPKTRTSRIEKGYLSAHEAAS
ncbi:MAG TPA: DNA sulfur modification protein DndD [Bryobacteraceae bacterium]|nr:DNA sulfur modification protein DndD [Bryobacteraceae bacterium]